MFELFTGAHNKPIGMLVLAQVNTENQCITHHPGFQDVCLNRWVLEIAALGLQTKGRMIKSMYLIYSAVTFL